MHMLIFLPPTDFHDESLSMLRLFFDRWEIKYSITSYTSKQCTGKHGATVKPDIHTAAVDSTQYDGIVFIDGDSIDSAKLYDFRPLLDLTMLFDRNGKQIWAIGNSVKILARANVIKGKKVAVPKNEESVRLVSLFHGEPSSSEFEISGNIVTINPGANMESSINSIFEKLNIK